MKVILQIDPILIVNYTSIQNVDNECFVKLIFKETFNISEL
jgi:hypothetical protein